ncbi:hypothetical protein GCK72_000396 [Caenorhabditis remanei]|uniref:Uncharacterized protein n=1 Tax=Caenorhabditis remanei TaxID=31234 RepID=A0A6A5HPQ5_CAERE|nr:hypothetical protein GCK72_000396 [Caenorhabditis remanei]KAF1768584.1 hypothetical protein GCK72_000396 [Caenorhabditis remanei]
MRRGTQKKGGNKKKNGGGPRKSGSPSKGGNRGDGKPTGRAPKSPEKISDEKSCENVPPKVVKGPMTPEKTPKPVESESADILEKKEGKERKNEENGKKKEISEDQVDGRGKKEEKTVDEEQKNRRSEPVKPKEKDPEKYFEIYDWEKNDDEYNVQQAIFVKRYHRKFAAVLRLIDPEFRYAAGIGPCETFDTDGIKKLIEGMKKLGVPNPWPFDEQFKTTFDEIRLFFAEVLTKIKFCLRLACAERGYEYKSGKQNAHSVSAIWEEKMHPIAELKTIKSIMDEAKSAIMRDSAVEGTTRFWSEYDDIFNEIVPALEAFNSKKLSSYSISDCMATIHGRRDLGFKITEEEVDKMLEHSFKEDGFGEFPPTALYAPEVFTTVNHLKLIFGQLEKMSKVIDIRVKLSGIQTITRIFELIDDEESEKIMKEFEGHPKIPIEKMFSFNPINFEVNGGNQPKRGQYLKVFCTTLAENNIGDDFIFNAKRLIAALKTLYLVFSASEINMIIFKIISTKLKSEILEKDQQILFDVLLTLPEYLKKLLEIGPDYYKGELADKNEDSMYFQIKNIIKNGVKDGISRIFNFLKYNSERETSITSAEKVMRMAMKCIDSGSNQMMAVETLKLLTPLSFTKFRFSDEFFEDLIVLALRKYSYPDPKTSVKKYEFVDTVFEILDKYNEKGLMKIDEKKIMEDWANCSHPWFCVFYLSYRFNVLKFSSQRLPTDFPLPSAGVWAEKGGIDLKKFVVLVKVPTSWPNCTDLKVMEDLIAEYVPAEVSRAELYAAMRDYVSEMDLDEGWKRKLVTVFKNKIQFLTSHANKAEKKAKEEKEKESKTEETTVEVAKSDVENVEKEAEEKAKKEAEPVEKGAEPSSDKEAELVETKSETLAPESASEGAPEEPKVEEKISEESVDSEDVTTKSEDVKEAEKEKSEELKSLNTLPPTSFISFYTQEQWDILEQKIQVEIMRQRAEKGYSNKMVGVTENDSTKINESPKPHYKLHNSMTLNDYIQEYKKTGQPRTSYPEGIWHQLPLEMKRQIRSHRQNNNQQYQSKRPSGGREEPAKQWKPPSQQQQKNGERFRKNSEKTTDRLVEPYGHDPNEKLSDDAFTESYSAQYWRILPQKVKVEINRQRAIKEYRAKLAAQSAAATTATTNNFPQPTGQSSQK